MKTRLRRRRSVMQERRDAWYPSAKDGYSDMPITPDGNLLTTAEAAAELNTTPATIRQHVKRGALTPTWIDKRTYAFTREEIERYRRDSLGKPGLSGKRKAEMVDE